MLPALGGCLALQPIETVRDVTAEPGLVRQRVRAELERLRLDPSGAADEDALTTRIDSVPVTWTRCRPMLLGDQEDRFRMVTARDREGEVTVALTSVPPVTQVRVTPRYRAAYRNPINGTSFDTPCESSGVLERRLLDAAQG
jgi:hypothetical protein